MPVIQSLNRREFLAALGGCVGALAMPHHGAFASVSAGADRKQFFVVGARRKARMIDLEKRLCRTIEIPFLPHSFLQHPQNPFRFIAIEKWGPGAAEIDFAEQVVVRELNCPAHHIYQGHGYYMPARDVFFITRTDKRDGLGHVVGFDNKTHKPVADYQITPGSLHECAFLSDKTLLVCSTGVRTAPGMPARSGERVAPSALVRLDVHTGAIVDERTISDPAQLFGHLAVTRTDGVVALTTPLPDKVEQAAMIAAAKKNPDQPYESPRRKSGAHGEVYFSPDAATTLKRIEWTGKKELGLEGEMLSVCLQSDHKRAAVTNPGGKLMLAFNAETGEFQQSKAIKAFGITYDRVGGAFIGNSEHMFRLERDFSSFKLLDILQEDGVTVMPFNGPHAMMVEVEQKA